MNPPFDAGTVRNCIVVPFAFAAHVKKLAILQTLYEIRHLKAVDDAHYAPLEDLALGMAVPEQNGANGITARQAFAFDCANHWTAAFAATAIRGNYWDDKWDTGKKAWTLSRVLGDLAQGGGL